MKVGSIALQTFTAPYTDNIEDKEETELQRKAAIDNSVPVLMIDNQINQQIHARLEKILGISNEIRSIVGIFPFLNSSILSPYVQSYLRSFPELEWQKFIGILDSNRQQNTKKQNSKPQLSLSNGVSDEAAFLQALSELEAYQFMTTESNFSALITQISEVRKRYNQGIEKALQIEASEELKQVYTAPVLLALSDNDWAKTQAGIRKSAERIMAQGIAAGLPKSILHNAVSLQVQLSVPSEAESFAKKVLLAVLQPNIKQDIEQTKQQAQILAREIPSVILTVKKGEIIVNKGEKITKLKFEILTHYHLIGHQVNWQCLTVLAAVVTLAIGVFVWLERKSHNYLRQRDRLLVLLLTLTVPGVLALGLPYTT
ncbi:MAG: phosphohydrolase, partial [Dolichospermum sp.]